ncbi:hypothetical protein Hanom_Chr02g00166801 [Helianthus anomalus]
MPIIPFWQRTVGVANFDFVIAKPTTLRRDAFLYTLYAKKINQTLTTTSNLLSFYLPYHILLSNTTSKKNSSPQSTTNMCPMRFLLVFFSAILAGYMAWKSVRTSSETDNNVFDDDSSIHKQECNSIKMARNGFWGFVDMASGKHIWRNLNQIKQDEKTKSS